MDDIGVENLDNNFLDPLVSINSYNIPSKENGGHASERMRSVQKQVVWVIFLCVWSCQELPLSPILGRKYFPTLQCFKSSSNVASVRPHMGQVLWQLKSEQTVHMRQLWSVDHKSYLGVLSWCIKSLPIEGSWRKNSSSSHERSHTKVGWYIILLFAFLSSLKLFRGIDAIFNYVMMPSIKASIT